MNTKTPNTEAVKRGKLRTGQHVSQIEVDAALLPKARGTTAGEPAAKTSIKIVAPVTARVAAGQEKMRNHAFRKAVSTVGTAIEEGTLSQKGARQLLVSRMTRELGSLEAAETWYRSHHLEELGGRTPAQMVRAGEIKALIEHLQAAKTKG